MSKNQTIAGIHPAENVIHSFRFNEDAPISNNDHLSLRHTAGVLQSFIEKSTAACFIKDEKLEYLFVNAAFHTQFGFDTASVLGKTDQDLFDARFSQASSANELQVINTLQPQSNVERLPVRDGSTHTFTVHRFLLTDSSNRNLVGGIAIDITQAETEQNHLRDKCELLELILNNLGDPVIAVDQLGKLLLFNPAAIKLHGLDGAKGKYGLFMPDQQTRYQQNQLPLARAIEGEEVHDLEIFVRTPYDAEGMTVSASAQPLRDKTGKLRGAAAVLRDISLRKKAEEALLSARDEALRASELKSQFVSNISHELRTPMSGVLGMTELLREMNLTADQQELATYIYDSAQNLLKVVNGLLDFSRLEAGKLQMEKTTLNIHELVEDCTTAKLEPAVRKGLKLSYQLESDVPTQLRGDPLRTKQVLTNFLDNAIKFTDQGAITINVKIARHFQGGVVLRFTVKDTGVGVPAHLQDALFMPFVQADGSNTRKHGGVGLGLSICRRLVKLMSGDVGVSSIEGEGSDFWFEIPLEAVGRVDDR